MVKLSLDREMVEAAVVGGAALGGGGGGPMEAGRRVGLLAIELGQPKLIDLEDIAADAVLLSTSLIGAPSAERAMVLPIYHSRAVELLRSCANLDIDGLTTDECGGASVTNGWLQAAILDIPVVDAPGNGRAHPIGAMGAMGLHRLDGYESVQAAIGGDPDADRYVEVYVKGTLDKASAVVRQAAIQAGGIVAVAGNPVAAAYAASYSAAGGVKRAITLGRGLLRQQAIGPLSMVNLFCDETDGTVAIRGTVLERRLETKDGFDIGKVVIKETEGDRACELSFCNEYMTLDWLDQDGRPNERAATFPDLITTFDRRSGFPVSTAEITNGQEVQVTVVPKANLALGAGMMDSRLFSSIEEATGREIISQAFPDE